MLAICCCRMIRSSSLSHYQVIDVHLKNGYRRVAGSRRLGQFESFVVDKALISWISFFAGRAGPIRIAGCQRWLHVDRGSPDWAAKGDSRCAWRFRMKFGKLLEQSARPEWAVNYVNYKVAPACSRYLKGKCLLTWACFCSVRSERKIKSRFMRISQRSKISFKRNARRCIKPCEIYRKTTRPSPLCNGFPVELIFCS